MLQPGIGCHAWQRKGTLFAIIATTVPHISHLISPCYSLHQLLQPASAYITFLTSPCYIPTSSPPHPCQATCPTPALGPQTPTSIQL